MAVYKRSYRAYGGPLTSEWSRLLVIPRYARKGLFRSRFLTIYLVTCFFCPLVCALLIYLQHNLGAIAGQFNLRAPEFNAIGPRFFLVYLTVQSTFAWVLTAFVGPGLISPDLANSALPLYFCRPFSRTEYVLGKMSVLLALLSAITWMPGLLLFVIESSLSGWDWFTANLWLAWAIFAGSWLWIVVISLMALALSAWIRWRIAAGGLLMAALFLAAGIAQVINAVMRTSNGHIVDIGWLIGRVWNDLFRLPGGGPNELSQADAWSALAAFCALCLFLLARKVRACEVIS